jgi:hypothetical protein
MSQPVIADLLARIEELERGSSPTTPTPARARTPRRRRVAFAVVALAGLLLVPVGVFASHQFTDVSNSNTFHASISKVKLAGITGGCSATKYCPNDEVTRGQMAAFLQRTAPRAETAFFINEALSGSEEELASFPIKAGGATGGTAALVVNATVTVRVDDASACPCTAAFYIDSDLAPIGSFEQYATVTAEDVDFGDDNGVWGVATTSITVLIQIPTGVTDNVYLIGYVLDGGGVMEAYGEMVGSVALFDGLGNNVSIPATTSGASGGPGARGDR